MYFRQAPALQSLVGPNDFPRNFIELSGKGLEMLEFEGPCQQRTMHADR
jgi:hypothetical protein